MLIIRLYYLQSFSRLLILWSTHFIVIWELKENLCVAHLEIYLQGSAVTVILGVGHIGIHLQH